jgi:endogenous inhibitor of DNA gyrase (YacG/DUF329 family)
MAELIVKCPHCGQKVAWLETNRFKPFCSERCRLIDLGEWIDEEKRIIDNSPISELHDEMN